MKNWVVVTIIGILVIALAASVALNALEVGKIKNNNAQIASQQAEIAKVEAPRHFSSLDELNAFLKQAAVNTKYAALRPIERAYILQVLALRAGYLLPAGFTVGATTFDAFNTAYISGTIYRVDPSTNTVTDMGPNGTPLVINPIASQPLPAP